MTYWIAQNSMRNHTDVYHTDENCRHLSKANEKREVSKDRIEFHDLNECAYCAGTANLGKQSGNRKYQNLLKEAAQDG